MKGNHFVIWLFRAILWIPLFFFSVLLAHNAMLYFTHGGEYGILPEKVVARNDMIWNICFYTHLPAGVICLFTPLLLLARTFIKKGLRLHKIVGKVYVWITLLVVCPTGMYLALYAKGGFVTQTGFMVQGILLAMFTWKGYQAIRKGDKSEHLHFMIRSYAVATVVLSFRIFHILFFILQIPYQDNYAISQWLGLAGNLLVAELCIVVASQKKNHLSQIKSQSYETI
jgi:hypothetical protein